MRRSANGWPNVQFLGDTSGSLTGIQTRYNAFGRFLTANKFLAVDTATNATQIGPAGVNLRGFVRRFRVLGAQPLTRHKVSGNDQFLNIIGAFIYARSADPAINSFHGEILQIAIAT